MKLERDFAQHIRERIEWLKQKEHAQRDPDSGDYDENPLLRGRTQGNIGALEWVLREAKQPKEE